MNILEKFKLLWTVKKAKDEVSKANTSGFSWGVAFKKMGKNFLFVLGGLLAVHFSDPSSWAQLLGVLPEDLQKVLIPLTVSAAMLVQNWRKNRKNEIVSVVEVEESQPNERRKTPIPKAGARPVTLSMKRTSLPMGEDIA